MLRQSRLATWGAKARGLTSVRAEAARHGVELGNVLAGSRRQPDGMLLTWELTDLYCIVAGGILPFFIDWAGRCILRQPHHKARNSWGFAPSTRTPIMLNRCFARSELIFRSPDLSERLLAKGR